mmetsp:Transcript_78737/g.255091  ORF Transcript_78737/g.255091 Transcript_78737/m.255091 type:complete len:283 (-) Transcript_78737:351-1199(-)
MGFPPLLKALGLLGSTSFSAEPLLPIPPLPAREDAFGLLCRTFAGAAFATLFSTGGPLLPAAPLPLPLPARTSAASLAALASSSAASRSTNSGSSGSASSAFTACSDAMTRHSSAPRPLESAYAKKSTVSPTEGLEPSSMSSRCTKTLPLCLPADWCLMGMDGFIHPKFPFQERTSPLARPPGRRVRGGCCLAPLGVPRPAPAEWTPGARAARPAVCPAAVPLLRTLATAVRDANRPSVGRFEMVLFTPFGTHGAWTCGWLWTPAPADVTLHCWAPKPLPSA